MEASDRHALIAEVSASPFSLCLVPCLLYPLRLRLENRIGSGVPGTRLLSPGLQVPSLKGGPADQRCRMWSKQAGLGAGAQVQLQPGVHGQQGQTPSA